MESDKIQKAKNSILLISIFLFLFSLTKKCYCTENGECADSFIVLLMGWVGVFFLDSSIAWLANPFLILAWYNLEINSKWSLPFSILATFLSFSFHFSEEVLANEAGHSVIGSGLTVRLQWW